MNPILALPSPLPMGVERGASLAARTTLRVGGPADHLATAENTPHLQSLLIWANGQSLPVWVLGEGSNVVVHDGGVRGLVVWLRPGNRPFVTVTKQTSEHVTVAVPGAALWGDVVLELAGMGLYGAEALYGIPGTAGAAPVQNIGAYGQDLSQTLAAVTVMDLKSGDQTTLGAGDCGLGYRTSHLRGAWANRYVVTALSLRLSRTRQRAIGYPSLVAALQSRGQDPASATPTEVAQAVYAVRQARGMVWHKDQAGPGTVGSFFTNPVVTPAQSQALQAQHPSMPVWPGASGHKLSAAWLIEAAGVPKGWRCDDVGGRVGTSPLHALGLVNFGSATAQDVCHAATVIYKKVQDRLGVALTAEAQRVGFAQSQAPFA